MGREAQVRAEWRGASGAVKALLESQELILRGAIRARIPRADITAVHAAGQRLVLDCDGERLVLEFGVEAGAESGGDAERGAAAAVRWRTALLTPPPSLASKLGVDPEHPAYPLGVLDDAALREALLGATVSEPGRAASILAVIENAAAVAAALEVSASWPELPLWCVYPKGASGPVTGAELREELRALGYIDTKSSAVSDRLTATRYVRRSGGA